MQSEVVPRRLLAREPLGEPKSPKLCLGKMSEGNIAILSTR